MGTYRINLFAKPVGTQELLLLSRSTLPAGPQQRPHPPALESGRGSPLLRQAVEAAGIVSWLLGEEIRCGGRRGSPPCSTRPSCLILPTLSVSVFVAVALLALPLCSFISSLLSVCQTLSICPIMPVCLTSSLSILLCPSVRLTPSSIFICLSILSFYPSDPEVNGSQRWAAADVVPALSEPLSWPRGGKGLSSVMVTEEACKAHFPPPSTPSSTQSPREPQSPPTNCE